MSKEANTAQVTCVRQATRGLLYNVYSQWVFIRRTQQTEVKWKA